MARLNPTLHPSSFAKFLAKVNTTATASSPSIPKTSASPSHSRDRDGDGSVGRDTSTANREEGNVQESLLPERKPRRRRRRASISPRTPRITMTEHESPESGSHVEAKNVSAGIEASSSPATREIPDDDDRTHVSGKTNSEVGSAGAGVEVGEEEHGRKVRTCLQIHALVLGRLNKLPVGDGVGADEVKLLHGYLGKCERDLCYLGRGERSEAEERLREKCIDVLELVVSRVLGLEEMFKGGMDGEVEDET
ncbi:MAG: hypothetical protein Q9195_009090 [Heterodermia aff. obscurata]